MQKRKDELAVEREFDRFLFREEILGEKILIYFRAFLSIVLLIGAVLFLKRRMYTQVSSIMIIMVLISFLYNALLFYIIKKGFYKRFIKYISAFLDITSTSFFLYLASVTQSPLAIITTSGPFYLAILMVTANLRRSKVFTLFNIAYILICYNFIYFVNYPVLRVISNSKLFFMVSLEGHFFKSFALFTLGVLLYLMLELRLRLATRLVKEVLYSKTIREELHQIYDSIIRSVSDGIIIIDRDGVIKFVNKATEKLTGLKYSEIIGKNISSLLYPCEGEEHSDRGGSETFELVSGVYREYFLKNKNGETIPVEISSAPMKKIEGQVVVTVRDISLRKELEEELLQSKKMETIGRLTCGFAHDFNNLILVMEENTKVIDEWFSRIGNVYRKKKLKKYININRNIIEKSKDLVDHLLMLGRRKTPTLKVASTEKIVIGIENILVNMVPQNIKLEVMNQLPKNESFLLNEAALFQILMNLIINACDAIGEKEGRIQIKIEEGNASRFLDESLKGDFEVIKRILVPRDKGNVLFFSVKDSGGGIEESKAFKIFEPYFSTKSRKQGKRSGFGLSIVYTLISAVGGGLVLKSTPGKGTEFCFCMPVKIVEKKKVEDQVDSSDLLLDKPRAFQNRLRFVSGDYTGDYMDKEDKRTSETEEYINAPEYLPSGKRILLIDDEGDIRFFVRKMLERFGFEVAEAEGGEEARKLIENECDFTLAIVDYNLNGKYGFREIEKIAHKKGLPIVLMTGDVNEEVSQTKERGIVKAILKKPFEDDDLLKVIAENSR